MWASVLGALLENSDETIPKPTLSRHPSMRIVVARIFALEGTTCAELRTCFAIHTIVLRAHAASPSQMVLDMCHAHAPCGGGLPPLNAPRACGWDVLARAKPASDARCMHGSTASIRNVRQARRARYCQILGACPASDVCSARSTKSKHGRRHHPDANKLASPCPQAERAHNLTRDNSKII